MVGSVQFAQDSTIYVIAIVIKEGVVSDLFKIEFSSTPPRILPPDGNYQIRYKANSVHFTTSDGQNSYVFRTSPVALPTKKGLRQWQVKNVKRIDPDAYPLIEG